MTDPTTVDIWFCDLDAVPTHHIPLTERVEHAERVREQARRGLRQVLKHHLAVPADDVRLVRAACPRCGGPHGRPELHPTHGGQARLRFSMAHTAGLAVYAVARHAVGVDVEALAARVDEDDLRSTLHPDEQRQADTLPTGPDEAPAAFRRRALLGCWVRKEAYLKGLGIGLGREPDTVAVGIAPTVPTAPTPAPGPGGWALVDLPAGPDHVAAVAVETPRPLGTTVRVHTLETTSEGPRQVDHRVCVQQT